MWYADEKAVDELGAVGRTKLSCRSFKACTVPLIGILALGARYTPEMYSIDLNPLSELLNAHVTSWWLAFFIKFSVLNFTDPVRTSSDTPPSQYWCGAGLRRMPSGRWRPAIWRPSLSTSASTSGLSRPVLPRRLWRVVGWVGFLSDVIGGVENALWEGYPASTLGHGVCVIVYVFGACLVLVCRGRYGLGGRFFFSFWDRVWAE
jgi:hypothetical protein